MLKYICKYFVYINDLWIFVSHVKRDKTPDLGFWLWFVYKIFFNLWFYYYFFIYPIYIYYYFKVYIMMTQIPVPNLLYGRACLQRWCTDHHRSPQITADCLQRMVQAPHRAEHRLAEDLKEGWSALTAASIKRQRVTL